MAGVASHVCIVTETYPPEINGVAATLAQLASGMRARGHVVSLVRPRQPAVDRSSAAPEVRTLLVRSVPLPGYSSLRMGLPAGSALRAEWHRCRPDAVYVATEGPLGWSAVRAGAALGIPVSSGFHTNFDRYMRHYGVGWLRGPIAAYLRRFHKATTGTLVSTPRLRAQLTAAGFERLSVLGRGVDSMRFDPARRSAALRAAWGGAAQDLVAWDLTAAMWAGLAALFLRQFGHAILEPPCPDKEATLLGYNTRNKSLILGTYLAIPIANVVWSGAYTLEALRLPASTVAYEWFLLTAAVVAGRVAYLLWKHGPRLALVWFVKLATDPLTDVIAYSPRFLRPA
jgi:glycosyl transferase family 4